MGFAVSRIDELLMDFAVYRREVAVSRHGSMRYNALRRFSLRIDGLLMEVAVSRCGSTTPIELTHGLRHLSQADQDTERLSVTGYFFQVFIFA